MTSCGAVLIGRPACASGSHPNVLRLLGGWSLIIGGRHGRAQRADLSQPGARGTDSPDSRGPRGVDLAVRRAEAMRRLFPKLAAWRASPTSVARVAAYYGHLAQAADSDDLEQRIRRIERAARAAGDAADGTRHVG